MNSIPRITIMYSFPSLILKDILGSCFSIKINGSYKKIAKVALEVVWLYNLISADLNFLTNILNE
jgi:hypothetical protein